MHSVHSHMHHWGRLFNQFTILTKHGHEAEVCEKEAMVLWHSTAYLLLLALVALVPDFYKTSRLGSWLLFVLLALRWVERSRQCQQEENCSLLVWKFFPVFLLHQSWAVCSMMHIISLRLFNIMSLWNLYIMMIGFVFKPSSVSHGNKDWIIDCSHFPLFPSLTVR